MVCEVCRTGPEGVIEAGALWAAEGTNTEGCSEERSDDKTGRKANRTN